MPLSIFYEWMVYEQMEPFGDRRGDLQAAIISSTIARSFGNADVTPNDFLPKWDVRKSATVQQTPEEQFAIMLAIQAAQNAKLNKENE